MRQSWLSPLAATHPRAPRAEGSSRSRRSRPARPSPGSAATSSTGPSSNDARRRGPDPHAADRRRPLPREHPPFDDADYVNHSCDPNCGIVGSVLLVTMRDVAAGEELCFDYAMTDTDDYDEFECSCGTPTCRGTVTGADWKEPELRDRYRGWCSAYIERLIS